MQVLNFYEQFWRLLMFQGKHLEFDVDDNDNNSLNTTCTFAHTLCLLGFRITISGLWWPNFSSVSVLWKLNVKFFLNGFIRSMAFVFSFFTLSKLHGVASCCLFTHQSHERNRHLPIPLPCFPSTSSQPHILGLWVCSPDLPSLDQLCETAHDKLFNRMLSNSSHILNPLLPPLTVASENYDPRPKALRTRQWFNFFFFFASPIHESHERVLRIFSLDPV